MNRNFFKLLSIIVLFLFSWTFAGVFQVAYAIDNLPQTSNNTHTSRTPKSEERFQKAIEEIGEILEDPSADRETKASKIKTKKAEIEELDKEVRKQFAETEKKLRDAGLPHEILQRHHKFVKHYEDNLNELKANLDAIEKTKGLAVEVEIERAKKHLERVKPPKKHIPLDPNKLPHRTPKIERKEPRLKKEDFERDFIKPQKAEAPKKPILIASNGSLKGLLSENTEYQIQNLNSSNSVGPIHELPLPSLNLQIAQASNQPTPADLAENIEVQFTPEIRAKAEELGFNPVKIYNWVRNNIEFVPTYGSIQGAHMTLLTKQGNAFDTASLLIGLLRAANIPARYVYGTIEIPIDKVMNWVGGFTDPKSAVDLIASGGIPGVALTSGGKIIAVRMEHMWVEAYVPYGNYRGMKRDDSIVTWIPMDGSFKQYTYKDPIDFPAAVGFDIQAFVNEVESASLIDSSNSSIANVPQDLILQRVQSYIQNVHQYYDTTLQNKTADDIMGSKRVIAKEYPYLLGSLPYKTIVLGNRYSQLPSSLHWRINFQVISSTYSFEPDLSYTASTAFLAGKSITVSYRPSTSNDESLVQAYGYIEKVPPYLLNLTPELIIKGEVAITGIPVGSGTDIEFLMTFISPNGFQDVVSNREIVGAYLGIGLDLNWVSKSLLDQKIAELNRVYNTPIQNLNNKLQESLSVLASFYFAELDAMNNLAERFLKVVGVRHPSAGIIGSDIKVSYLWGVPRTLSFTGFFIDVDRDVHSAASKEGDRTKVIAFNIKKGLNGSSMENALWEQIYNLPAVSAVRVHQLANQVGIPIHKIDQSNISTVLQILQISNESKADISNAVNSGKTVYIPQRNIQYYDWTGTAYIVVDPNTGAGGYIISGGLAGGGSALSWEDCFWAAVQVADLVPLPGSLASINIILDFLAYKGVQRDIAKAPSSVPDINKKIASILAMASLIAGLSMVFLPLSPLVIFILIVSEIILYLSIFRLLEGEFPSLDHNPLQSCFDLFR